MIMTDPLKLIFDVAHMDPKPHFVFQIYSYSYEIGSVRCAIEIAEGDYTLWVLEAPGVYMTIYQDHEDFEFTFYPPDREDLLPFDYQEVPDEQ